MPYGLIKVSALPETTPDESQEIVVGVGDYAKRINYGDVKNDMVGTSPTYTTDTEPYLMRRTANVGVVGKCALNKLVGGSLGRNQLVPHTASTGTNGGFTFTNNGDGSWTITGTGTSNNAFLNLDYVSGHNCFTANHVYIILPNQSGASTLSSVGVRFYGLKETSSPYETYVPYIVKCVASPTSTGYTRLQVSNGNGINIGTVKLVPQIYDLTQMFGSTIADYINGLGQTDGIAWLSKYIDLGTYHEYDSGSIQSVQATAHVTTGKNLFDPNFSDWSERSAYRSLYNIIPEGMDARFTFTNRDTSVSISGINLGFWGGTMPTSGSPTYFNWVINNGTVQTNMTNTPTGLTVKCRNVFIYPKTQATLDTLLARYNIMVELGTTATAYVPYEKHTYSLGSDTLRGVPQLISNKLQFDGDIKTPDGTITRKYGIVDMGTLTWTYNSSYDYFSTADLTTFKTQTANGVYPNIICSKYMTTTNNSVAGSANNPDKSIASRNASHTLYVKDSAFTDASTFTTAVTGVYLVYELETASTESSTSYQKIQTIDADGTESFTTSTPVPVGHETQTADNILAALGWLGE